MIESDECLQCTAIYAIIRLCSNGLVSTKSLRPSCAPGRVFPRSSFPKPMDSVFSSPKELASDELRGQNDHVSGLWDGFRIHGGRAGVLRAEGLHQRAHALPVVPAVAQGIRRRSWRLWRARQLW